MIGKLLKEKSVWESVARLFSLTLIIVSIVGGILTSYAYGFRNGADSLKHEYERVMEDYLNDNPKVITYTKPEETPTQTQAPIVKNVQKEEWGGPELWEKVNAKRVSYGVNPLREKDELCTIASLRLNELLELGKLDGHEGFSSLSQRRPDLKWIFEKYVIAEFLLSGAQSADEAASLWENTLGHKKILTGGEYAFGCIYAQNTFAIGITAYE